jgi:hypothetical protein
LLASTISIVLWSLEHLSDDDRLAAIFAFSTVPFKLTILAAAVFLIPPLSRFLCGRLALATILAATLIITTWLAILAYLPFRQLFVTAFDADQYHWYHDGMALQHGDFSQWKTDWNRKRPHLIEASMVLFFYGTLITVCRLRCWRLAGSIMIAAAAYAFLEFTPLYFGLLVWDYDEFLKGIVFDSISLDLSPFAIWWPCDFSIFLYAFSFIFFAVASTFIAANPTKTKACELTTDPNLQRPERRAGGSSHQTMPFRRSRKPNIIIQRK